MKQVHASGMTNLKPGRVMEFICKERHLLHKKEKSNLAKLFICSMFLPRMNGNRVTVSRQSKDASFHGLPCNIGDYTGEVLILNLDTCMHLYNLDQHIFHVAEDNCRELD